MYRFLALWLTTVISLSAHMLEVSFDEAPGSSDSTIRGSVRNVSGRSIIGIRVLGFAFGPRGLFLGQGKSTIKAIPTDTPVDFLLELDVEYRNIEKIYLQFEAQGKVLSYEVKDGPSPDPWLGIPLFIHRPSPQQMSQLIHRPSPQPLSQTVSQSPQHTAAPPQGCELLVVGMVSDLSAQNREGQELNINGRLKNISGNDIVHPNIRITLYDSIGAYFGEDSKELHKCGILGEAAECAFRYSLSFPTLVKNYEVDFITYRGIGIPHCLR